MSTRITSYAEAFDLINVSYTDKVKERMHKYEQEGHTEKSICYTIWKKSDKLMSFRGDSRFWGVLENELKKYSWTTNDPRWETYNKNKAR